MSLRKTIETCASGVVFCLCFGVFVLLGQITSGCKTLEGRGAVSLSRTTSPDGSVDAMITFPDAYASQPYEVRLMPVDEVPSSPDAVSVATLLGFELKHKIPIKLIWISPNTLQIAVDNGTLRILKSEVLVGNRNIRITTTGPIRSDREAKRIWEAENAAEERHNHPYGVSDDVLGRDDPNYVPGKGKGSRTQRL